MTSPRMLLPNTTYMVTKRCSERRFFLTPTPGVNQVFAYCLAYGAQQTGVLLHAWAVMGNHWHAVVTDPDARLPDFMALVDRLVATCMNTKLHRFEAFWSTEPYSAVRIEDEDTLLEKLLYVLANPVEAALVEANSHWPGLISGPRACAARPKMIKRPDLYFDPGGGMPAEVELAAALPPWFEGRTPQQLAARLAALLRAREKEIVARHTAEGRKILGRDAVVGQDPFRCPKQYKPTKKLDPRVACLSKWRMAEALQHLKDFLDAYREAWLAFKAGVENVVFPAGTYWMRRHAGYATAPA